MTETFKVETFVPEEAFEKIRDELYAKGFGKIGNYENCLSWFKVNSSWKPVAGADPYQGTVGKTEFAEEIKIELRCDKTELSEVVKTIKTNHPYEEVCINVMKIYEV